MPTVLTEVEVEVDLCDFDDEDLIDELERRGIAPDFNVIEIIQKLHVAYQLRQVHSVEGLMRDLFYKGIGRIV